MESTAHHVQLVENGGVIGVKFVHSTEILVNIKYIKCLQ